MSQRIESDNNVDIRIGEVVWPRAWDGPRSDEQQRNLRTLVRDSGHGLILDCSSVEIGNSEIINLLMRVRNHANKLHRELVLFNVPDTLRELIAMCKLESVLSIESDQAAATMLVLNRVKASGRLRRPAAAKG